MRCVVSDIPHAEAVRCDSLELAVGACSAVGSVRSGGDTLRFSVAIGSDLLASGEDEAVSFISDVLDGKATWDDENDYIDSWHTAESDDELEDFLGLSFDEYELWLRGGISIEQIVMERQGSRIGFSKEDKTPYVIVPEGDIRKLSYGGWEFKSFYIGDGKWGINFDSVKRMKL